MGHIKEAIFPYKIFAIFATLITTLTVSAQSNNVVIDGITYEIYKEETVAKIVEASNATRSDITIPSHILYEGKQYPVTEISLPRTKNEYDDMGASYRCNLVPFGSDEHPITSVKFPATLKTVNCSWPYLKEVHVDDMSIWCNIEFPSLLVAEDHYSGLVSSYSKRWGITNPLVYGALLYVNGKYSRDITIPKEITEIKENSFIGGDFDMITFEGPVSSFGKDAFLRCNVKAFNITDLKAWCNISCTVSSLFAYHSTTELEYSIEYRHEEVNETPIVYFYPMKNDRELYIRGVKFDGNLVIPEGTKAINNGFSFYNDLKSVRVPESVETIATDAFEGCPNKSIVYIPSMKYLYSTNTGNLLSNVKECHIGEDILEVDLYVPEWVKTIDSYKFKDFEAVSSVYLNNNVTEIGDYAFSGCSNLEYIDFGNKLKKIGDYSFNNCEKLTSLILPKSVESIGYGAFYKSSNIKDIWCYSEKMPIVPGPYYDPNDPRPSPFTFVSYTLHVPDGCYSEYNKESNEDVKYAFYSGNRTIVLFDPTLPLQFNTEETVNIDGIIYGINSKDNTAIITEASAPTCQDITIPEYVLFEGREYPVTEILLPYKYLNFDFEKVLGSFGSDEHPVTSVKFPSTLKRVVCTWPNLKEVNVDDMSVWCNIDFPFIQTSYNKEVSSLSKWSTTNPLAYGAKLLVNGEYSENISIPTGVSAIKDNSFVGGEFNIIKFEGPLSSVGKDAFINSKINGFNVTDFAAWCKVTRTEKSIPGDNSKTYIYRDMDTESPIEYAYPMENNRALYINGVKIGESFEIPEGIKILNNGLSMCADLKSITIPESIDSISDSAFEGCIAKTTVHMASIEDLMGTYTGCLLSGVTDLDFNGNPFDGVLETDVATIDKYKFKEFPLLRSIKLNNIVDIQQEAFSGCVNLSEIDLGESIKIIDEGAFYGCGKLTAISFPKSIEEINGKAFEGCEALTDIWCWKKTDPYNRSVFDYYRIRPFSINTEDSAILHIPYGNSYTFGWRSAFNGFQNIEEFDNGESGVDSVNSSNTRFQLVGNELSFPDESGIGTILICDITGHSIYSGPAKDQTLSSGIYILSIDGKTSKILVK